MTGKKGKNTEEIEADFFGGEDLQWLDDDSEIIKRKRKQTSAFPVAPPPPPLFESGDASSVLPRDQAEADWSQRVSKAPVDPAELSRAKTLVFSQVPTLPPVDVDPVEEEVTVAVDPSEIPEEDQPTASVPRPPEAPPGAEAEQGHVPPPSAPAPPTFDDEIPVSEEEAASPSEPAPIRMQMPEDERPAVLPPRATPPQPRPHAVLPPFPAGDSEDKWKEVANALMSEAAAADSGAQGELLYRAGWVYHHQLEDLYGAESLYRDALNGGCQTPVILRQMADISVSLGRWGEAADLLKERAALLDGPGAAESLRESAILYLDRLQNPGAGVARLWEALEANPEDYAALVLLRDHLSDVQPERAEVLDRIALLSDGAVAAEALSERGRLLEQSDPEEAVSAYQAALEAHPGHGPTFAALESLLARQSDHAGLATLYTSQTSRDPSGAGWWQVLAGRNWILAGETEKGEQCFASAGDLGWDFAAREAQARLFKSEKWDRLAASLEREAAATEGAQKAFGLYRLGWVRERHLGDLSGALQAYKQAESEDAKAKPASDAVRRVLRLQGDRNQLSGFLAQTLEVTSDPRKKKALLLRLAETAEDAGDFGAARKWYESLLEVQPGHGVAMGGLARSLERLEDWEPLQALLRRRADTVQSPDLKAHYLYAAGAVGRSTATDPVVAIALHRAALELVPDHPASLEAVCVLLSDAQRWAEKARLLQNAAEASAEKSRKVHLFYRAGRILAMNTEDKAGARACLTSALELDADFEPALQLALDLSATDGDVQKVCTWYRGQAARASDPEERDWAWFAAAVMAGFGSEAARGDIRTLLATSPEHQGGRGAWEQICLATDDVDALADVCRSETVGEPSVGRARQALRLAEILAQRSRTEDATRILENVPVMTVEGAPILAAARLARRTGAQDAAANLLEKLGGPDATLERAVLLSRRRKDRDAAREQVAAVLEQNPLSLESALVASRLGALAEDRVLVAEGRAQLAKLGQGDAVQTANALWAGALFEELSRPDRALEMFRMARTAAPFSGVATMGVLRCLLSTKDLEGVSSLLDGSIDPITVASATQQLGDPEGAARVLLAASQTAQPVLPVLLHLEAAQESAEDWQGVYNTLVRRLEVSKDDTQRNMAESRRRWILAERLCDTDEAWVLFRQLHEEEPGDREITESLARIAAARGETALAIEYLGVLATGADTPEESARYQRRIADAYRASGADGEARQAYLDALDYVPTDSEALDGLKNLATAKEDWPGLLQVLQREADLVDGERGIAVRREIARVNEEKLGNGRVAIEAWRGVTEYIPQDEEALSRLLVLSEQEGEWGVFVETGNVLAALASGAERTTLLRRIGVVCADQLNRDDAVRYFEQATSEQPPDLEAAERLETLYRKRGDWKGVARALEVQGAASPSNEGKVAALQRAAQLELETRHDREAASKYYQKILMVEPSQEAALRFMASHLFEAGRFDEALPVCERLEPVVEHDQDLDDFDTRMELAQFYFYFAEMLRLAGDGTDAMARYERALALNPSHLASLQAVGPLYIEAEHWKKAENVYRSLLQLSGGQGERHKVASTYTQLGLVERALGNPDKAQKRFNKALETYPNHVEALKGVALLLEDREDWSNLLNVYNNIIYHATVAEDVIDAYMTKGRILDDHMSRPDKAAQHYQRSLDFKADQAFAMLCLAELAMRRDDHQAAGDLAEQAMRLETDERDAAMPLLQLVAAAAHQDAGRKGEALELLKAVDETFMGDALNPGVLEDLEGLRQLIKDQMPG